MYFGSENVTWFLHLQFPRIKNDGNKFSKDIVQKDLLIFRGSGGGHSRIFHGIYRKTSLNFLKSYICQYEIKCNRYWTFPVLLQNYIPTQVLSSTLHAESKHKLFFPSLISLKRPEGTAGYRPWKVCYCNPSDRRISFPKLWIHPKPFFFLIILTIISVHISLWSKTKVRVSLWNILCSGSTSLHFLILAQKTKYSVTKKFVVVAYKPWLQMIIQNSILPETFCSHATNNQI